MDIKRVIARPNIQTVLKTVLPTKPVHFSLEMYNLIKQFKNRDHAEQYKNGFGGMTSNEVYAKLVELGFTYPKTTVQVALSNLSGKVDPCIDVGFLPTTNEQCYHCYRYYQVR